MFVSAELEDQHVPEVEMSELHNKLADHFPGMTMRRRQEELEADKEGKLTEAQWNVLVAFWEHRLFRVGRYVGMLCSVDAFILTAAALGASKWSEYKGR